MINLKTAKLSAGFTIIELIISISILSVAIVGIFSAFSIITILTSDSADRLTGTYLAQEGMEIVRNIRDNNWLNMDVCLGPEGTRPPGILCPAWWTDGFTMDTEGLTKNGRMNCSCAQIDNNCIGCEADYTAGTGTHTLNAMSQWTNSKLLSSDGFYGYQPGGTPTKFKRKFIINPIQDVPINEVSDSNHIVKVIVQVSWDEKATILTPVYTPAGTCGAANCITAEETLYDWYNYVNE